MSNRDYWINRFTDLEKSQINKGAKYYDDLKKQYQMAAERVEKETTKWLARIAANNEITMDEAKKLLKANELEEFRWSVDEYIAKGTTLNYTQKWAKQLENASSRWHISRLEAMQVQMRQQIEELYAAEVPDMMSFLGSIYKDSYYHTAYELQKGIGVGINLGAIDKKRVGQIVAKPWAADGSNFSDRIWRQKAHLISELQNGMTQSLIRGGTPEEAIKHIQDRFRVSAGQAGRLVMTETVYFHSAGQLDMYKEMGVAEYEICAVLDTKTSKICQDLDGTHRPISEFMPGVTAPPFHCWCRSTTVPYFDDEFTVDETRAARDDTGKTIRVPGDMTYKEWKESFVEGNKSDLKKPEADDAIAQYVMSRKEYNAQVQELAKSEREVDDAQDAYMDVMDTPQASKYEAALNDKFQKAESLRQAIKDLKAELSGKEAKAVRQAEKNLAVKTGIPLDKVEMTGLQYDTADMIYSSYKAVLGKYPELKGQLAAFKYDGVKGDAYASCRTLTGEVQAHGIFANYDEVVKSYADDVAAGFHPVGTDHNSIIVHELGHALDGYMTKKKLLSADYNQYGILRSASKSAKDMTLKFLGFDRQEIAIELKSQGLTLSQRRDMMDKKEKEFIAKHVSKYAAEDNEEFFAECFSEYVTSDNPREAAKIFGEIIDKALGR